MFWVDYLCFLPLRFNTHLERDPFPGMLIQGQLVRELQDVALGDESILVQGLKNLPELPGLGALPKVIDQDHTDQPCQQQGDLEFSADLIGPFHFNVGSVLA